MVGQYNRKCNRCGLFKPHTKYAGVYGGHFMCQDCKDYLNSQKKTKKRIKTYKEEKTITEPERRNIKNFYNKLYDVK